jgi:hypothetical protein
MQHSHTGATEGQSLEVTEVPELTCTGWRIGRVPDSAAPLSVQAPHISNKHSTQLKVSESGEVSSSLIFSFLPFCYLFPSGHFEGTSPREWLLEVFLVA